MDRFPFGAHREAGATCTWVSFKAEYADGDYIAVDSGLAIGWASIPGENLQSNAVSSKLGLCLNDRLQYMR